MGGPAAAVGLTAEAELLDAVVADVAGRPAALPLLSTALVGTWERRRGDRLTLAGYLEAGGVAGALARSAEAAYAALDDEGRESPAACSCGWPTPTTAGRWSGGRLPLSELDLDEPVAPGGGRRLRRPAAALGGRRSCSTSRTRRC